jgi:hypothetical protein
MNKQLTIKTTAELLEFIKRDEVTAEQGTDIVCKALQVLSIFELTKDELIQQTEQCIKIFFQNDNSVRPLVLGQKNKVFSIKDIYCSDENTN